MESENKTNEILEIYINLCYYDIRKPNDNIFDSSDITDIIFESNFKTIEQQKDCKCDNCISGLTKLANSFINYIIETNKIKSINFDSLFMDKKKLTKNKDIVKQPIIHQKFIQVIGKPNPKDFI